MMNLLIFHSKRPGFSALGHRTRQNSVLMLEMVAILASLTCNAKCLRLTKLANWDTPVY